MLSLKKNLENGKEALWHFYLPIPHTHTPPPSALHLEASSPFKQSPLPVRGLARCSRLCCLTQKSSGPYWETLRDVTHGSCGGQTAAGLWSSIKPGENPGEGRPGERCEQSERFSGSTDVSRRKSEPNCAVAGARSAGGVQRQI